MHGWEKNKEASARCGGGKFANLKEDGAKLVGAAKDELAFLLDDLADLADIPDS